jgi:hypothetical protein
MKKILHKLILFVAVFSLILGGIPFSSFSSITNAQAVKCDKEFYSNNDVLFYNPCATSCSDASSSAADVTSVHGKNNGEKIFNFWLDAGLTAQQAAGITGSMQNEGGFSPFRQEISQTWPAGGYGIAQFTGGQRDSVTKFLISSVGAADFSQYYANGFGGGVTEANGFIPPGIPVDINDKFLLGELNYLLQTVKSLVPNNIRTSKLQADYSQVIPPGTKLYDYLKTIVQAGDAAIAWTYLYEYPADIKATSAKRSNSANDILKLYSAGITTSCGGGLSTGGMTLAQGVKFMNDYKTNPDNVKYIAGAGQDCPGGPLSNCVSFSVFFVRKYTNLKESGAAGNGSTVVPHLIGLNPTVKNGHSPQPYAIFSVASGSQFCGAVKCGHTGVILGVDTARGKVIVGEASCGNDISWDTAREYPLSLFDNGLYTYIYTDGLLKGAVQ